MGDFQSALDEKDQACRAEEGNVSKLKSEISYLNIELQNRTDASKAAYAKLLEQKEKVEKEQEEYYTKLLKAERENHAKESERLSTVISILREESEEKKREISTAKRSHEADKAALEEEFYEKMLKMREAEASNV